MGDCDLVIMNPPFTRNDIRNRQLPDDVRDKVQQREVEIAKKTCDPLHKKAIDQSTVDTFFVPIADRLLKSERGTLAMVKPFTFCTGTAARHVRALLADSQRFHLDLVITSHDNRRVYFSENTSIHESLIIARRPTSETQNKPTAFVSLVDNPAYPSDAYFLAKAIQEALDGDHTGLAKYGTIAWRSLEQLRHRPWNAAAFYDQTLAEDYDALHTNPALANLSDLAAVEPGGQRVRDAFRGARQRQSPDMRALWHHKSERQKAMRTSADEFLVAKKGQSDYAKHLWQKRSHLLLANRLGFAFARTPAVFSDEPILGSGFVPALPKGDEETRLCKAWCVWLNSTVGILAFLNIRQRNLAYPSFSLDGLRTLPVPHPEQCDIDALATAFDQLADKELLPLPKITSDTVRQALDDAVLEAVPGLTSKTLGVWRKAIAQEPSVNNEKEQFRLA